MASAHRNSSFLTPLTWAQWRAYAVACSLRPWLDGGRLTAVEQWPDLSLWWQIYGDEVLADLPLGVGEGLSALAADLHEAEVMMKSHPDGRAQEVTTDKMAITDKLL